MSQVSRFCLAFEKNTPQNQISLNESSELLIVKLNKLLNYADMLFYKQNGVSMTGTRYVHLPYGPVPDQYALLYAMLEKRGLVTSVYEQLDNGYEKHMLKTGCNKMEYTFTPEELSVLQDVNKKFANFGSKQIADYSHNERGYDCVKFSSQFRF